MIFRCVRPRVASTELVRCGACYWWRLARHGAIVTARAPGSRGSSVPGHVAGAGPAQGDTRRPGPVTWPRIMDRARDTESALLDNKAGAQNIIVFWTPSLNCFVTSLELRLFREHEMLLTGVFTKHDGTFNIVTLVRSGPRLHSSQADCVTRARILAYVKCFCIK